MGTMPLRGVIFDADGVLQHPNPGPIGPWTEVQHRVFATRLYSGWLSPEDMLEAAQIEARCEALLQEMAWPGDPATYLTLWAARAVDAELGVSSRDRVVDEARLGECRYTCRSGTGTTSPRVRRW